MKEFGVKSPNADLSKIGLNNTNTIFWNLSPAELTERTIKLGQGILNNTGALVVDTGEFTGRAPLDKFIVKDAITEKTVDWGGFNTAFDSDKFDRLYDKVMNYLADKEIYVRDGFACASTKYQLNLRVINEYPWSNLFAHNLFLRYDLNEIKEGKIEEPEWQVIAAPGFMADAAADGTRQHNFSIVSFTKKVILIGGSAYTGEMKKGIFTVLNYILPQEKEVLSMHCSANIGDEGDTAIFFGLSGTGKTTLSADPMRKLIGDDEHGWANDLVFNFEGGCYAKCIDLTKEKEPQIFAAVKFGALLENIKFFDKSRKVNYADASRTENTRVSYPINYIDNALDISIGNTPKNIFFLTCDAFGVLPPISKLTVGQAMYHYISGYTAKTAGTETGITEPKTTFSACFGAPFLPLHPTKYAELLGKKMKENKVNVWLVNTGWTGGPYGVGKRMKLTYTRALITAALKGDLDNVTYEKHPVFGLEMPLTCPHVPSEVLNPRNTWENREAYDAKANELANSFVQNFKKFADQANEEILSAAPKTAVTTV